MSFTRRSLASLVTAVLLSAPAAAQRAAVSRVTLTSPLAVPGVVPSANFTAHTHSSMLQVTQALALMTPIAGAPRSNAQTALADSAKAIQPSQRVAPALEALEPAASRPDREDGRLRGGALFDGSRRRAEAPATHVVNDEGVRIFGRAARYYHEVRRMVDLYKGTIDLRSSLDVMDEAYAEVVAKVSAVEAIAKGRGLSHENTHLEETLVWVDGVLTDGARKIAVHTYRVYFHKAKDRKSEIAEGIRRANGYIWDAERMFERGGRAERQLQRLDAVELVFDARGYPEIKDHLKKRGKEISARTGGRITFKLLDEIAPLPKEQAAIRARLNQLARKYNGAGLSKIYEGVIYSRYVGLLLELKTIEHYHKRGYKILQSGRELFDKNGMYVSELDVVVESPRGVVSVVEAKSARISLSPEEVLRGKVVYKLNTYKKFKAELDAMIGRKFSSVVFALDVAIDPNIDPSRVQPRDLPKLALIQFLKSKEAALSKEYGFPVSFLFLQSGPAR